MEYAVEGIQLHKIFAKKRSVGELLKHPFRRADRIRALRGVDIQVREGQIFGLLGPNGAGKTTLLKILSCLVLPDRGRATILGQDTNNENRVKPNIGLVNTDERSFYWRLSGIENLSFFATLYDVPRKRVKSRIQELLELVGLEDAATQRFADYSAGMKQRLAIARSLLHDPPVLLMDEPTRSLDPAASLSLRSFILDQLKGQKGKTIVLATHNLPEAEALCDRVAILVKGRVLELGTVPEIRRWGLQKRCFRLEVDAWPSDLDGPFHLLSDQRADGGRRVTVSVDEGAELGDLMRVVLQAGVVVRACDRVERDLEEAFSRILESEEPPS